MARTRPAQPCAAPRTRLRVPAPLFILAFESLPRQVRCFIFDPPESGQNLTGLDELPPSDARRIVVVPTKGREEVGMYVERLLEDLSSELLRDLRDELRKLDFAAVMMSGSGTTIFCIGEPAAAPESWQSELQASFREKGLPLEVYAERFCGRPEDDTRWYND